MKLLRAKFDNFRLLKDTEIEFSTEASRNITLIRASNESGKTTALIGLEWALYGDEALPGGGKEYRLHPLDSPTASGTEVSISATVEYEVEGRSGRRRYLLVRSATERIDGEDWERNRSTVQLFHVSRTGTDPLDNPEAQIRPHLPNELREVFFTDGDRALRFIEGKKGEQMRRVEDAIRSLLGLDIVEDAVTHTSQASRKLNSKVKDVSGQKREQSKASEEIERIDEELPAAKDALHDATAKRIALVDLVDEADEALIDALRKGNREELAGELESIRAEWTRADKMVGKATRDQANLFKSQTLARQLMSATFEKAKSILDELHDRGKFRVRQCQSCKNGWRARIAYVARLFEMKTVMGGGVGSTYKA